MKNIPILILHGWNLSAAKFDPLVKELERRGHKVICFDLPGFGKNKNLTYPLTIQDYSKFVINKIKKREIKQIILIGHSFGGRIGIYLSVQYPLMVKGMIISGTPALGADLTAKEKVYLFLAKTGKILFNFPLLGNLKDYARKLLYKLVGSYDYYRAHGTLRETFKNIVSFRLEPLLNKLFIPILIIWGKDDRIVPVKVAYDMHRLIRNSNLVIIADARHGLPWTHPKIFAEEVDRFIEKLK